MIDSARWPISVFQNIWRHPNASCSTASTSILLSHQNNTNYVAVLLFVMSELKRFLPFVQRQSSESRAFIKHQSRLCYYRSVTLQLTTSPSPAMFVVDVINCWSRSWLANVHCQSQRPGARLLIGPTDFCCEAKGFVLPTGQTLPLGRMKILWTFWRGGEAVYQASYPLLSNRKKCTSPRKTANYHNTFSKTLKQFQTQTWHWCQSICLNIPGLYLFKKCQLQNIFNWYTINYTV